MKRLLILLSLSFAAILVGNPANADADPFDEIIIFGASMSDSGNAHILSNGQFGGPPNFGGRFSDGPVWVELLAENLGFGTPTEDDPVPGNSEAMGEDKGTNYAVGGAGSGDGLSGVGAPNIGLQIDFLLVRDGKTLNGDELIVIQGGGNERSHEIAAVNILRHIDRLAAAGGKYFLVNNHFRGGQAPAVVDDPWADNYVAKYGEKLAEGLDEIEAKYDVTIYRFDMLGLHDDMIANPDDYGLTNLTDQLKKSSGGVADEYMWWDGLHFTTKVHGFFADAAADLILE
jgi:phospholipase/lecithinase/hemolysin